MIVELTNIEGFHDTVTEGAEPQEYHRLTYEGEDGDVQATLELTIPVREGQTVPEYGDKIDIQLPDTLEPLPEEAPVNVDIPHLSQSGQVLTCTMGNWEGEPTHYDYTWLRDASEELASGSDTYNITAEDAGHTITCVVTASNDVGSTEAEPSNEVEVLDAARSRQAGGRSDPRRGSPMQPGPDRPGRPSTGRPEPRRSEAPAPVEEEPEPEPPKPPSRFGSNRRR